MAGDINKSINITIKLIDGVTKKAKSFSDSFSNLSKSIDSSLKSLNKLNKNIKDIKVPSGFTKFTKDLNKLENIKLPSFTQTNKELNIHTRKIRNLAIAYDKLSESLKKVNIKNILKDVKEGSKSTKKLKNEVKDSSIKFSQWAYAIGSASTGLSKFGARIYGVSRGFAVIGKEMGLAATAFSAAFSSLFAIKGVISTIYEFDDAIRAAGAVAQASSVQLIQFSDAARAMGESTRYTAVDAANALKALAMTGLDVNESIATLPTVLNVAAAANMSLGESADIVTNIMVGYGKTVKDLPRIADLMTAAFTNSNTSLSEIGLALKYVGPVAKASGQSLEETTGILASLANAGYRGAKSGIILRTSIANLLSPTNKMKDVLKNYNISLEQLSNPDGTMTSFTSILEIMKDKGIKAGDAMTLFGKRAGPGVLALLQQGLPAIREMNAKIAESEGIALKVAYEMESGLGGALRRLKSMWEEVSIAIGKVIEQDIESFITKLTKSLDKNKEQIVSFISSLFSLFKIFANISEFIGNFLVSHIKLISAIGAISAAVKLLTMSSKELVSINIISYFIDLTKNIKWNVGIVGIQKLTGALIGYTNAVKSGEAVSIGSSISNFIKSIAASGAANTIKAIGSSLLFLGKSAYAAASAFIVANPALMAVVGIATLAYGAIKILNTDYEKSAQNSLKMADSTKELNRELEYQLAELNLINNLYNNENIIDYSNAEERLSDIIKKANLSIEERISFLKRSRSGSEEAKKAIIDLTKEIQKEKEANDEKQIINTTKARESQAKAIEKQAKKIELYYGISIDGQTRLNSLEKIAAATNTIAPIIWLKKKLGYLEKNLKQYEELKAKQKIINSGYENMVAKLIVAGKSSDDFAKSLKRSGESKDNIDILAKSYSELKKEADSNINVMNDLKKVSSDVMKALEDDSRQLLEYYKESSQERENINKKVLYNISVQEAEGIISHEEAEMAKLQSTLNLSHQQLKAAKETYEKIDSAEISGREKAMAEIMKVENKATDTRLAILNKISSAEKSVTEKIISWNSKKTQEVSKNEIKIGELRDNLNKKIQEAEVKKTDKIKEINEKLSNKLKDLAQKLSDKRKQLQDKRVQEVLSSTQKIANIETSAEDTIRAIKQKGMTDKQKDDDNRLAATEKLKQGEELVAEAKANGDTAALERGTKLIQQSSELYAGLESETEAIKGVQSAAEDLKEAERLRSDLALKDIDKKIKAEEEAAKQAKKIAEQAAESDKERAGENYEKRLQKANEFYQEELNQENTNSKKKIDNINNEIDKYNDKLSVIESEKNSVLSLIEEYKRIENFKGGYEAWSKANIATDEAISKVKQYSETIDGLDDKEVNIKFTGEASPKAPLGDKLNEITEKFSQISSEIEVNVKFMTSGESLSTGIKTLKNEVESIEINIPASVDVEELDAVIVLINKYKNMGINIDIKVNSGDLNTVVNTIKGMVNKAIAITVKIIGYDNLVKAKSLIDSIKSKTVTITTKHNTITEKASGGYIEPQNYNKGGNVFKRLSSRFIAQGDGKKDDVPAMLMKGEYVQKVSAVKKYGKDFMAKLNAGLIPQRVAKMFNSGGEVQQYAKGGHVGYSNLPKNSKKKILELLNGKISDININDSNIITEIGESSMKRMSNTFSNTVSAFATGGGISQGTAQISSEKNKIMSEYANRIAIEQGDGNTRIAEVMKAERESLMEISERLKEELKNIKEEYDEYVLQETESYSSEKSEKEKNNTSNKSDLKEEYETDSKSAKKEYDDEEKKSDEEYNEEKQKSEEEKLKINDDYESVKNSIYTEIAQYKSDLRKSADELYKFAKNAKAINNESQIWVESGDGTVTMRKDYTATDYLGDKDNPDREMIAAIITTIKETKRDDYDKENLMMKLDSLWSDFSSAENKLLKIGVSDPVSLLRKSVYGDVEKVADAVAEAGKKKSIKDIEDSFSEITDKYNEDKTIRKESYDNNSNERENTYNEAIKSEDISLSEEIQVDESNFADVLSEAKESYNDNVKNATNNAKNESKSVNDSSKSEIDSIKDDVANTISTLESEKKDQILSLSEAKKDEEIRYKEEGVTTKGTEYSIFDLMKKRLKIFGFNTGGLVNSTPDSIPGKDSILSALTPNEYVMKASVVKKFGKGFFDSLNNFRIPQFNVGGLVGKETASALRSSTTVRHSLNLTINGSKKGELTGSEFDINNIINDLALAKLSS